jgi:glycerol-3-phosphate acyltransferase PlsY
LVVDVGKGWLAVFLALHLGVSLWCVASVALAVFLGHLYPVFLRFEGGKGVATALGVFLALTPGATLVLLGIFVVVVAITRIVSLGSIAGALAAPMVFWAFHIPPLIVATSGVIALMIAWRHRSNIQRLLAGTEPKFG